jgi:hypothetical protein
MKKFAVVLVLAVAALGLPYPAARAATAAPGIPGYYNPLTGSFTPLIVKSVPLATPVSRIGTVQIAITLTVESAIGIGDPITCNASIISFDSSFSNTASATGLIVRTGTTGKVTIVIPYDWTMAATGESATVSVSCNEGTSFEAGGIGRTITFTVPGFVVPATAGALTVKSLTASM